MTYLLHIAYLSRQGTNSNLGTWHRKYKCLFRGVYTSLKNVSKKLE